jgi:uncharacterized protein
MLRKVALAIAILGCVGMASTSEAAAATTKPLLDCPMRDTAFSVDSPLIDLLLSDAAKAVIERHAPGAIEKMPPVLKATKAPSFGAITTFRKISTTFESTRAIDLAKLDADLKSVQVTPADQAARCARYDDIRVSFMPPSKKPRVLVFEKINGFRDSDSVLAASIALRDMADRMGWGMSITDRAGMMHPSVLQHYDAVVWNNVSGDVLTTAQRDAFRRFIEDGGGFVGIHGSGGDPVYFWDWYVDSLIGARFIGHPSEPQFQSARVNIVANRKGIGRGLESWTMNDEWYSFAKSARLNGAQVIAVIDEKSYAPGKSRMDGTSLEMGDDHPIAWTRCVGKGRSFYSAIGHRPEAYSDANHLKLLEQAIVWASTKTNSGCD